LGNGNRWKKKKPRRFGAWRERGGEATGRQCLSLKGKKARNLARKEKPLSRGGGCIARQKRPRTKASAGATLNIEGPMTAPLEGGAKKKGKTPVNGRKGRKHLKSKGVSLFNRQDNDT